MKYVNDLITEVRRDSRNEDIPTGASEIGISTEDFLRYINLAQEKCQAIAISAKSTKFRTTKEITLVSGTMEYSISDRVYLDEHILNVEISSSGLAKDYNPISERSLSARSDSPSPLPSFYIRKGGNLLLCPVYNSSGAKARVTFDRAVDTLDIRRGTIVSHTNSGTAITALTLSTTDDDEDALAIAQYLCVNDVFGNVTMYNIPITAYDSSTGVVSIKNNSFTFQSGETIANGSYVTIGEYTTTHSKLNHLCEKYLAQYAEYRIFRRDSSSDAVEAKSDMRDSLKDIATSYNETPRDNSNIEIDNDDLVVGNLW